MNTKPLAANLFRYAEILEQEANRINLLWEPKWPDYAFTLWAASGLPQFHYDPGNCTKW